MQAGREIVNATRNVSEGLFERLLIVESNRVRDGPVNAAQVRQFLMGVIAHRDHQILIPHHSVYQAWLDSIKVQTMPAGDVNGPRRHMVRRMSSR